MNTKITWGTALFVIILGIPFLLPKSNIEQPQETIQKEEKNNGFFDSQSWMKGERELQLWEMRTRKEELEKDISSFDSIETAHISFDISHQKIFGPSQNKTKASVILSLKEGEELSRSQLLAVIYHLSAAVQGLEPNEIAISDTTGKLYKAIYCDELYPQNTIEEQITEKIKKLMTVLVGKGNFYVTVQLPQGKHLVTVILTVPLDVINREMIENHIRALLMPLDEEPTIIIDSVTVRTNKDLPKTISYFQSAWFYFGITLFLTVFFLFFIIMNKDKNEKKKVDFTKLAEQIKEQEPKSIALICSYLEPEKAEALFSALPHKVQKKVALHLKQEET